MSHTIRALAVLLLTASTALVAGAQNNSDTGGLMVGAGLSSMTVNADFGTTTTSEFGIGFHGEVSYGFQRPIVLFARYSSVVVDAEIDYDAAQLDVGARYVFLGTAQNFRPYVELGVARRAFTQLDVIIGEVEPGEITRSSTGVTAGVGAQLFVTPRLAVDAAATVAPGTFNEWSTFGRPVPVDGISVTTIGIRAGVKLWPFKK